MIPHLEQLTIAARRGGAIGAALSGAGPSILTLVRPEQIAAVTTALAETAAAIGVVGTIQRFQPVLTGAHIVDEPPSG